MSTVIAHERMLVHFLKMTLRKCAISIAFMCFVQCSIVEYEILSDGRLCNNGAVLEHYGQKCITRSAPWIDVGPEYDCNTGVVSIEECQMAVVQMPDFSAAQLLSLLPDLERTNLSVRRLVIKLDTFSAAHYEQEIDSFLTPRPWWYVEKEPYDWETVPERSTREVVLGRVRQTYEPQLKVLAALQYPHTQHICAATPLQLLHRDFKHPGWYAVLAAFAYTRLALPYAVSAVYVSSANSANESTSFISAADCPDTVNRWECAFLPVTNCTLPSVVTGCTGRDCVVNSVGDAHAFSALFDSTSASGRSLAPNARSAGLGSTEHQQWLQLLNRAEQPSPHNHALQEVLVEAADQPALQMKYLKPAQFDKVEFNNGMVAAMDLFTYNLLLRPSALYRARLALTVDTFRKQHNFSTTERCVAAQIRRGDRAPSGNITALCLDATRRTTDMGCEAVPFAAVTLRHVVESAALLVDEGVRTLVVSTDDEAWLQEQRMLLVHTHPEWRVLSLSVPWEAQPSSGQSGQERYKHLRYGMGTASGMLLWGSIALSRQCEAFVGHFGCGGARLLYESMCAQHNHREYVCPPAFDVRTIRELQVPQRR